MANDDSISGGGIAGRFVLAIVVVFATFNPWSKSFFHWAVAPIFATGGGIGTLGPLKVLAGILLVIGWVICLQTTRRSLGVKGALLVAALLGTLVWLLIDQRLLTAGSSKSIALIVLVVIGGILGIGMSWSHLSRKLTGQVDTDQVA